MIRLHKLRGRVNPRARPRRHRRPLVRGFTAKEKRPDFRLNGPFYRFDPYKGPSVVEWDGEAHQIVFHGDYDQCQAYLAYRSNTGTPTNG